MLHTNFAVQSCYKLLLVIHCTFRSVFKDVHYTPESSISKKMRSFEIVLYLRNFDHMTTKLVYSIISWYLKLPVFQILVSTFIMRKILKTLLISNCVIWNTFKQYSDFVLWNRMIWYLLIHVVPNLFIRNLSFLYTFVRERVKTNF